MNRKIITELGLMLCAGGLILSCAGEPSSEPAPETSGPKEVGFAVTDMESRAVITSDKDKILSLGIFGYSTGTSDFDPDDTSMLPNLFGNRRVTRADAASEWVYSPRAFWPTTAEKSTFFAYSPHEDDIASGVVEASGESTPGFPYVIYTVEQDTNVSKQVDLLYSEYVTGTDEDGIPVSWNANVSNINSATNGGKVLYNMKHAMTWIRFMIVPVKESGEAEEIYAITEFDFSGGYIAASSKLNLCTGEWTAERYGPVNYSFDHLAQLPNKCQNIRVADGPQCLGTTENCLMMIPQDIVLKENKTTVLVAYWYDKDGPPDYDLTEYYVTMPFPDVKLRPGSVMTYIVKLSTSGAWLELDSENTIEEWLENSDSRPVEVH